MAGGTLMAAGGIGGWNIEAAAGGISINHHHPPPHHSHLYSSAYFPNPSNSYRSNKTHHLYHHRSVLAAATHQPNKKKSSSDEKWVAKGVITESLPNGMFWVRLENGDVVLGYVSGRIRRNSIRMLAGDYVHIELTRYDSTRGRIVFRLPASTPNNNNAAAKHS